MRFAAARGLFEALGTRDPVERRRLLGWVVTHPAECTALDSDRGQDVIGVLIGLADTDRDYTLWEDVAVALGAFDDPRVTEFFTRMLAGSRSAVAAFDAAAALEHRDRSGLADRLVEILMGAGPPERAVAVAELLVDADDLPEAAAVRVAALEDDREPPPLTPGTVSAWIAELSGPFAREARERLEGEGTAALEALAKYRDRLSGEDREWLREWAADGSTEPHRASTETRAADGPEQLAAQLASDSPEVRALAREALVELGAPSIEPLRPLVRSGREEVRAGAVRALLDLGDDEWLARELLDQPPKGPTGGASSSSSS